MQAASTSSSTSFGAVPNNDHVHFNRATGKYEYEASDGREYEWDTATNAWVPVVDDSLVQAQQAAYRVQGVDESTPAAPVLARDKKRKQKADDDGEEGQERKGGRKPVQRNTAVYVTHLPLDADAEELHSVFSKAGLILEDEKGQPRIKFYEDEAGRPKGEALVVYLKEESVELAVRLFDETELRYGANGGDTIKVQKAEFKPKEARPADGAGPGDAKKKKRQKKADRLRSKLADWDSDEEAAAPSLRHGGKVVVLKRMFSKSELDADPALLLDLKEDVREEAETLGDVTNVTLYDLEDEGVMTIRFKDPISAQACIKKMHGRFFAGRRIEAGLHDGAKYQKSGRGGHDDEDEDGTQRETWTNYLGGSAPPAAPGPATTSSS